MNIIREIAENPTAAGLLFFLAAFIANRTLKLIKLLKETDNL